MDERVAATVPRAPTVQLFAATATAPVQWRLLSGNNRDIGHGASEYRDIETCRLAVKELQHGVDDAQSSVRRTSTNQWCWQLTRNGVAVAVSAHGFDRLIRCEQGLDYFRAGIRDAEIAIVLLISGTRRWGAHSSATVSSVTARPLR
jgi:hypothetical protein